MQYYFPLTKLINKSFFFLRCVKNKNLGSRKNVKYKHCITFHSNINTAMYTFCHYIRQTYTAKDSGVDSMSFSTSNRFSQKRKKQLIRLYYVYYVCEKFHPSLSCLCVTFSRVVWNIFQGFRPSNSFSTDKEKHLFVNFMCSFYLPTFIKINVYHYVDVSRKMIEDKSSRTIYVVV